MEDSNYSAMRKSFAKEQQAAFDKGLEILGWQGGTIWKVYDTLKKQGHEHAKVIEVAYGM